jgi:hypothetical protein
MQRDGFSRPEWSRARVREKRKLGCQAILSCLSVIIHPGMVIVVILLPRHVMAWRVMVLQCQL